MNTNENRREYGAFYIVQSVNGKRYVAQKYTRGDETRWDVLESGVVFDTCGKTLEPVYELDLYNPGWVKTEISPPAPEPSDADALRRALDGEVSDD